MYSGFPDGIVAQAVKVAAIIVMANKATRRIGVFIFFS
jgi:hypothetical protein